MTTTTTTTTTAATTTTIVTLTLLTLLVMMMLLIVLMCLMTLMMLMTLTTSMKSSMLTHDDNIVLLVSSLTLPVPYHITPLSLYPSHPPSILSLRVPGSRRCLGRVAVAGTRSLNFHDIAAPISRRASADGWLSAAPPVPRDSRPGSPPPPRSA